MVQSPRVPRAAHRVRVARSVRLPRLQGHRQSGPRQEARAPARESLLNLTSPPFAPRPVLRRNPVRGVFYWHR